MRDQVTIEDVTLTKDGTGVQLKGATDPKLLEELDVLKLNEKECREEIIILQDKLRMCRNFMHMKIVLMKDKH
jgi:hypothetical protein